MKLHPPGAPAGAPGGPPFFTGEKPISTIRKRLLTQTLGLRKEVAQQVSEREHPECPHCGQKMDKWAVPTASTWGAKFNFVCFNDECPYFVRGWNWMQEKYQARASYRHCIDPESGRSRPLPVWSHSALKDDIIHDDAESNEGVNQNTT